ncbi:hypothetical protein [Thalassotalea montiporae]
MNHKNELLLLLALLVTIKFIVVPIFEWQDELRAESAQLERKAAKTEAAIAQSDTLIKYNQNLKQQLEIIKSSIDEYDDLGKYQVAKQQQIERVFSEYSLDIKALTWHEPVPNQVGTTLKINVRFSGLVKNFMKAQFALYKSTQSLTIDSFSLNTRFQTDDSLGKTNGNLLIVYSPVENKRAAN